MFEGKRKIIVDLIGLSVFGVVVSACGTDSLNESNSGIDEYIDFGIGMSSRGLLESAEEMKSFKVWGWNKENGEDYLKNLFDGTIVTFEEGSWVYSPPKAWSLNNTYNFYAFYPDTITGLEYTSAGKLNIPYLDIRQNGEFSSEKNVDLLEARQLEVVETTPPEVVHLQFEHLLTKVNFKIKKSKENVNDEIVVTSVVIGGMNCIGCMKDNEWLFLDTETSYFYRLCNEKLETDNFLVFENLLMLPQTISEDNPIVLIVQYNYKHKESNTIQQKYLLTNLPTTPIWEKNTNVTYSATIHVDENISFSTPVVESWGTEQVAGTIVIK